MNPFSGGVRRSFGSTWKKVLGNAELPADSAKMQYETTKPLLARLLQGSTLIALLCSLFSLQQQQQKTAFGTAADPLVFPALMKNDAIVRSLLNLQH